MDKHDTSGKTKDDRQRGEHGTRDQLNDPRKKDGHFARQHHDPADTVNSLGKMGAHDDELKRRRRQAGETEKGRINRLGDDEAARRRARGIAPETDGERRDREIRECGDQIGDALGQGQADDLGDLPGFPYPSDGV